MEINKLKRHYQSENFRINELLNVANNFIVHIAPEQPSERVSNILTERNVRYYINQGLVDRPTGKDGVSALYEYRHLLQLIALKRLQLAYIPVKKIAEILNGKNESELHQIITEQATETKNQIENSALSFLNTISKPQKIDKKESRIPSSSAETMSIETPERMYQPSTISPKSSKLKSYSWERYELDDGIEIHIRDDQDRQAIKSKLKKRINEFMKNL